MINNKPLLLLTFLLAACLNNAWGESTEPSVCQQLLADADQQLDILSWVIKEGESLKRAGCWQSHTRLGEAAIASAVRQNRKAEQLQLSLQLASSYFYLGQYQRCLELAVQAEKLAEQQQRPHEQAESLYLQSAIARTKGSRESVILAQQALSLSEKELPKDHVLRAKILYNLGAALSDASEPDLVRARTALAEAAEIYQQKAGNHYDLTRTILRQARVEYLAKNYQQALATAKRARDYLTEPRARMLYYYQVGKILHRLQRWQDAQGHARKALSLANTLSAEKDRKRVQDLLKAIEKKTELAD